MEINHTVQGQVILFALKGRLDSIHAAQVEQSFAKLVDDGGRYFVWDLQQLNYISSAGLRIILTAAKKMKTLQGRIIFTSLNAQVTEIFEMSGLLKLLEVQASVEEALASF